MYRCQECDVVVGPNTQSRMARKGVRLRNYPPQPLPRTGKKKKKQKIRFGQPGNGWEAEQMLRVCHTCHPVLEETFEAELDLALGRAQETVLHEDIRMAAK